MTSKEKAEGNTEVGGQEIAQSQEGAGEDASIVNIETSGTSDRQTITTHCSHVTKSQHTHNTSTDNKKALGSDVITAADDGQTGKETQKMVGVLQLVRQPFSLSTS